MAQFDSDEDDVDDDKEEELTSRSLMDILGSINRRKIEK